MKFTIGNCKFTSGQCRPCAAALALSSSFASARGGADLRRSSTPRRRATRRRSAPSCRRRPTSTRPAVDGSTALHWAVHRDALDVVDLLLGAGANAEGGQPLRRDAALARRDQRQRAHRRAAARRRRRSERGAARRRDGADDRRRTGEVAVLKALVEANADVERARKHARPDGADVGGGRKQRRPRSRCSSRPAPM